jgi:ribosomal protein S18 acetylase RimI-like enzyme
VAQTWTIDRAGEPEWPAVLELSLQHLGAAERPARVLNALTLLSAGQLDADGVFAAHAQGGVVGAQLCVLLPGSSGLVWLPATTPAYAGTDLAAQLVEAAVTSLQRRGAKFAQALAEPSAAPRAEPLLRAGFRRVTQLLYLEHDLDSLPAEASVPGLRLENFSARPELFTRTLLHSYEGTRDCPELAGTRSIEEIIQGHKAQGKFRPENWRLALIDEQPAGVLLLSMLPDVSAWDLSYLGVVPEHRRRGLGRALTVHALHAAEKGGALQFFVAVDSRNTPALALYEALGFRQVGERDVYLRFFDAGGERSSASPT